MVGASGNEQTDTVSTSNAVCGECGRVDGTVRDLGLKIRYALCDPCFDDLLAIRTLAGPLPLSRVLDDVARGDDPLNAGRRSDTWRRTAPDDPADDEREDRTA